MKKTFLALTLLLLLGMQAWAVPAYRETFVHTQQITESDNGLISFNTNEDDNETRYTITYYEGEGTCATASWTQLSYGQSTTLPTPTINSQEWSFAGWTTSYISETTIRPNTLLTGSYTPNDDITLYAVYTRNVQDPTGTHTLNWSTELELQSMLLGNGNATNYIAKDGSEWVIKANNNDGMQINVNTNSSIKVPVCPSNITSISILQTNDRKLKFSSEDYTGNNNPIEIAASTSNRSTTINLSGKGLNTGYIYTNAGNTTIMKIVVNYGGDSTTYYATLPTKVTIGTAGWTTFSAAYNYTVDKPAYKATVDVNTNTIAIEQVNANGEIIPAEEGILIGGSSIATITPTIDNETADMTDNRLSGTASTTYTVDEDDIIYCLTKNTNEFNRVNEGVTIPLHKAFFRFSSAPAAPLRISLPEQVATGVEQTLSGSPLMGESVKVLINGKLVIIRDGNMFSTSMASW